MTSDDFPLPETPVTATSIPSGNSTSIPLRLFSVAPTTVSEPPIPKAAGGGTDGAPPRQVVASDRLRLGDEVIKSPSATIRPPCSPAPADVDDVVGDADGLLVVLHHDEGVAHVAQSYQRLDQPLVVALVEPDRRLVEDVEHPDQPDPIWVASRTAAPRHRPGWLRPARWYSSPTSSRNWRRARISLSTRSAMWRWRSSSSRSSKNSAAALSESVETSWMLVLADRHRQGDRVGAAPLAGVAGDLAHVLLVVLAGGIALRIGVTPPQEGEHLLVAGCTRASSRIGWCTTP